MIVRKMSNTGKGLNLAFFRTYRDKLVGLLLEKITNLNIMFYSDSFLHSITEAQLIKLIMRV